MELKVLCECGQKFKFDVEPVNGQMPFTVNCPVCNADATAAANTLIAEQLASAAPPQISTPPPTIAPAFGGLRINRVAHAETVSPPVIAGSTLPPIGAIKPLSTHKKAQPKSEEFSLGRGILGAFIGSAAGCGVLFGFWLWTHFRFPLMGTLTGLAAGYTARWLARGTDTTLGVISAAIAGASVTGIFVVMYGEFAAFNFISIIICAGLAYRITSG